MVGRVRGVNVEKQRERPKSKEPVREKEPPAPEETEAPVRTQISHQKELDYFKKLLNEIKASLAFSEYIQEFIDRIDGSEAIAIAIEMPETIEEMGTVPPVLSPEQQAAITPEESSYIALRNMHEWLDDVRYEFMYSPPSASNKENYKEWLEEWSKILFDFARIEKKHVIYVQELLKAKPFSEIRGGKDAIIGIGNELSQKKLAVWIVKKEKLRVYWKSMDEWAGALYNWAFENGKSEPMLAFDFKDANQDFSTLPDEEFPQIFKILEKQKKGHVVKTSDKKVAIVFHF
jgi:hypothetical protein